MTWPMEILMIELEEQLLLKYCMINHSILLKIRNTMDINVDFLQWFINFVHEKASGSGIKNENISNKELAEELGK